MGSKFVSESGGVQLKLTGSIKYYFAYCEAGFLTKTLGDVIITVGREGALELMEGVPL